MKRINLQEDVHPMSKFRAGVSSFLKQVTETKRPLLITQRGKGIAVLVDVGEFETLQEKLELLEDIYKSEVQIDQGKGIEHQAVTKRVMKRINQCK